MHILLPASISALKSMRSQLSTVEDAVADFVTANPRGGVTTY
jgi:hypothetical protein